MDGEKIEHLMPFIWYLCGLVKTRSDERIYR